ncbi:EamA family transporter [Bergeyella sp. RCAD1439]|uniref:EamA family transporter n=1 Tax=Bergeyella anatis TaxID=3113737 RepID=UPI002E1841B4|nr:DMT family transporter [Bergeyella sp. RCAD1439]
MGNNMLKGVFLVALGASFYGMLATFVKLAYGEGYTTAEVTTSQFVLGILGMGLLQWLWPKFSGKSFPEVAKSDKRKLFLAGTSMGGTSLFYYIAVQYINVSVAIVLLMQSVWISVFVEAVLSRTWPQFRKVVAVFIVLLGTVLATNVMGKTVALDWRGLFWGFMAAVSFSVTMFSANGLATYASPYAKTFWMLLGGGSVIALFLVFGQLGPYYSEKLRAVHGFFSENRSDVRAFDFSIFIKYGLVLSLFGTVLPPVLFNAGFPKVGLGLGSIVSSVELPVSVMMAYVLLNEKVALVQWFGIGLILFAIVLMNLPAMKTFRSRKRS